MESRTQHSRPKAQKKSEAKYLPYFLRSAALETKKRNGRGQRPRTIFKLLFKNYGPCFIIIFKLKSAQKLHFV